MKEIIESTISKFIDRYCKETGTPRYWREPIIKYADANHSAFNNIDEITGVDHHYMPHELLEDAKIIISYFLPLKQEVGKSDSLERRISNQWNKANMTTYDMCERMDQKIVQVVQEQGYHAVIPPNRDYISDVFLANRWSDRHIAWFAGMGTFRENNLLITKEGCCGFFFSVLTNLPIEPDSMLEDQLYFDRTKEIYNICITRCIVGALTEKQPNHQKYQECIEMRMQNESFTKWQRPMVNA